MNRVTGLMRIGRNKEGDTNMTMTTTDGTEDKRLTGAEPTLEERRQLDECDAAIRQLQATLLQAEQRLQAEPHATSAHFTLLEFARRRAEEALAEPKARRQAILNGIARRSFYVQLRAEKAGEQRRELAKVQARINALEEPLREGVAYCHNCALPIEHGRCGCFHPQFPAERMTGGYTALEPG